jgi:hypothetical protein
VETLLAENKIDKARDIIELAMTNMPVEHYDFYTFVEPFADGYYKVGETQKARDLFGKLKGIYQERLRYYAGIPLDEQYGRIEDILADMEAYRRNIDILIENNDRELAEKETLIFNELIDRFSQFYENDLLEGDEGIQEPPSDLIDSMPEADDTTAIDNTQIEILPDTLDPPQN